MTRHLGRKGELLRLERTGPYMPPITFPGIGDLVVTNEAKERIEASGLTGFTFRPVIKARIVSCNWEAWDRAAREPREYPRNGEPEGYILDRAHDEAIADQIGEVWEIDIAPSAHVIRGETARLVSASWNGSDLFRASEVRHNFASDRARGWIEANFPEHVAFHQVSES
jgi:hypothetical protein